MTTEAIKAASIASLDKSPPVRVYTGEGGAGLLRSISDSALVTTGTTVGSTYKMCRVNWEAKVKHVYVWFDAAMTTFAADIDVAYSDSAVDGTSVANQGTIVQISAADNKLFGAATDLHALVEPTDQINANAANFVAGSNNLPLWKAVGLTSNPGGMADIVVKGTGTASGTKTLHMEVQFVL